MGIGQPSVHGEKAHLRPIADNSQQVAEPDGRRGEDRRLAEELGVGQVVGAAQRKTPGVVDDRGREQ